MLKFQWIVIDRWGLPDKPSPFGFCPNSGDFSVDSVHKRLFLTPLTGEIFEQQKVPNLIWGSWSELVDSYSWVYNPPIKPNGTASLMLAQTLVYLTQVGWVASICSQSTFNSIWYDAAHIMPREKKRERQKPKSVYFLIIICVTAALGVGC